QFYFVALPWLVLQLTGSSLVLGTITMTAAIPRAALMLVGGALSDRFSPRGGVTCNPRSRHLDAQLGALASTVAALCSGLLFRCGRRLCRPRRPNLSPLACRAATTPVR